MSNFRDLIARMAIDAEFARHARANPEAVARQYHLSHDESEQLRGLADAAASAGPVALGARLSKMGGLASAALSAPLFIGPDTDGDGTADIFDLDDDNDGIPDATDAKPLQPNLLTFEPQIPIGPVGPITLNPDIIDPLGDADADKIPNILDKYDNNPNTTNEAWGDNDKDGVPNLEDPDHKAAHAGYALGLGLSGDADGDGIKDPVDANDSSTNTSSEPLGDKDGDGVYNYLDKFNIKFPVDVVFPDRLEPLSPGGGGGGDSSPPPASPPVSPPGGGGGDAGGASGGDTGGGGTGPGVPEVVSAADAPQAGPAPAQQPTLLADDAFGKPQAVAVSDEGGIGTGVLLAGGAAIAAAGVVAGGMAGKVFGDKTKEEE